MRKTPKAKAVRKAFDRLHDRGKVVVKDKIAKAKSDGLRMTITRDSCGANGGKQRRFNLTFVQWVSKDWDIEEIY